MLIEGEPIPGVEHGNAWAIHQAVIEQNPDNDSAARTNWIVGTGFAAPDNNLLRHMPATQVANTICIKWFVHHPGDNAQWGGNKLPSTGRTMSILANQGGSFRLEFWTHDPNHPAKPELPYRLILTDPGDFVVWGPKVAHCWEPLAVSTIVTIRWVPLVPES